MVRRVVARHAKGQVVKINIIYSFVVICLVLLPIDSVKALDNADCVKVCERKIVAYVVVRDSGFINKGDFEKKIEQLLKDGWQPFGGVATNKWSERFQVMVKYED